MARKLGVAAAVACGVTMTACGSATGHPGAVQTTSGAQAASAVRATSGARLAGPPALASVVPSHRAVRSAAGPAPSRTTGQTSAAGAYVPAAGQPVSTAHPDHVVGDGTAASCTSQAVVQAVAAGGVITFSCGPAPVTIVLTATAKVINTSTQVVLDGGGKVTLSGGGTRRILYMDTCDPAQTWTTAHCQDQATPHLTVQNMGFTDGNATGQLYDGGGGGAIFDRGGQLTVINSRFTGNQCDQSGPDLGGAAIRALSQYQNEPVYVVNSTFTGGVCSNGGALSSIGVSWVVLNSTMTGNQAVGNGANPPQPGTPGGGSGGAIYTDGDGYTVTIDGTVIYGNNAREGGGAIFFVSNDRTGTLHIVHSTLRHNVNDGFQTAGYPGVFFLGQGQPTVTDAALS